MLVIPEIIILQKSWHIEAKLRQESNIELMTSFSAIESNSESSSTGKFTSFLWGDFTRKKPN
jgi:hypothetical protein